MYNSAHNTLNFDLNGHQKKNIFICHFVELLFIQASQRTKPDESHLKI